MSELDDCLSDKTTVASESQVASVDEEQRRAEITAKLQTLSSIAELLAEGYSIDEIYGARINESSD